MIHEKLLSKPEIVRILKTLKNNEPVKIEGQHYITEVEFLEGKQINFFYPIVNKERWEMPTFSLLFLQDEIVYLGAIESDPVRKLLKILKERRQT
ncbi:MAG: hypothetical protein QXV73_04460 [Candidatus Micrarchaeia archaeon]